MLLSKPRSYAEVYNDLDEQIVGVFRCFRSRFSELEVRLRNTPFSRVEYDQAYQDTEDELEAAARTVIRSWMGFGNSAQRAGSKTGFQAMTEKTGSAKSMQWKSYLDYLEHFRDRLQGVVIECRDAFEVIAQQDTEDTLFFVDPPYVPTTRKSGTYKHELSLEQHGRLCETLQGVKGAVMLCGYANPLYDSLGWHRLDRETRSMASCDSERTECLWFNASAERRLPEPSLFGGG